MVIDVFGTNTSFRQGQTTATFTASGGSSGIVIHPPVEVLAASHLQITISIPADEPIGPQTLEVVTGNERAETEFRVEPQPSLDPLVPDVAEQGDTVTVTVTGVGTHFTASSCPLNPRMLIQGVEVLSWQAPVDDLTFDLVVSVALGAPEGLFEGAFELDCDYQTLSAAFEVTPAVRTIKIDPAEREQGTTGIVRIEANKADFESYFDVYINSPEGIDIGPPNVLNATTAEVEVVVHSYADPTPVRTLGVIDPYGTIEGVFRVTADPTPPSVSINPSILRPGDVTTVDANGVNTSFSASETTVSVEPADGLLTLVLIETPGPTPTLAQLTAEVAPAALEQEYLVTLSTGPEHVQGSLWVVPEPSITIYPVEENQNESVLIQVYGDNTHFDQNTTDVVLPAGSGLSYTGLDVADTLNATFTLHVAPDAQTGDIPGAITLETPISSGLESVSAAFRILDGIPAADLIPTGVAQGSQGFAVQAVGRYTHWSNADTTVTLDPACQGFVTIQNVAVATQTELSFQVDVALLAPANTICAIDIVTDDGVIHEQVQAELTVLPGGNQVLLPLPQTIQGYVDGPQLYSIHLNQGDVLRARASCDPVLYLDPTLAIYAPGGNHTSAPVAENEDEHAATDDALIVYQAPLAGTYYLVVQDRLGFEVGPFTLSLDNFAPELESELEPNNSLAQPGTIGTRLLRGGFSTTGSPLDVYSVSTSVPGNWVAVQVIAQSVSPYETSGADVILNLYNGTPALQASSDIGTESPDPVIYIPVGDLAFIELDNDVAGMLDTTYWINLRPQVVINEVRHDETSIPAWTASFVELYGEPGMDLTDCHLLGKAYDTAPQLIFDIDLTGHQLLSSGYLVIAHDNLVPGTGSAYIDSSLAIDDPGSAYTSIGVVLTCGAVPVVLDAVCWRGPDLAECNATYAPDDPAHRTIGRGFHIDTDDNAADFLPQPEPSPWNRNLREVW